MSSSPPNAAPTILDVKSNNLLLVFFIQSNAGGAPGVEVVNTSDTRIRFQDVIVTFSIITEKVNTERTFQLSIKGVPLLIRY